MASNILKKHMKRQKCWILIMWNI